LPPENSSTGLAHWPATSRRMWMASASSQSRWESVCLVSVDMICSAVPVGSGSAAEGAQRGTQAGAQGVEAAGQAAARGGGGGGHGSVLLHVQTAFLARGVFPPPAAGAHILTHRDRAGAGRAADAGV